MDIDGHLECLKELIYKEAYADALDCEDFWAEVDKEHKKAFSKMHSHITCNLSFLEIWFSPDDDSDVGHHVNLEDAMTNWADNDECKERLYKIVSKICGKDND